MCIWKKLDFWPLVQYNCHGKVMGTMPGEDFIYCPFCGEKIKWVESA